MYIPYFTESETFSSTLTLNNNLPEMTTATVTIFNRRGEPLALPPILLQPQLLARFNVKKLVSNDAGDFSSGNIQIFYHAPSMAVTSQLSVTSEKLRLSFESIEAEAMEFGSSRLIGIGWVPSDDAQAGVAVTNTTSKAITGSVSSSGQLTGRPRTFSLASHETQVIDLKELLMTKGGSPNAALLTLQHNGQPGDVIATGFILNPRNGFSSDLTLLDPSTAKSTRLAGAHFRFGTQDPKEGFPSGTVFQAPLVIANASDSPTEARISVDYTAASASTRIEIAKLSLAAHEIRSLDLAQELAAKSIFGPVQDAGMDIAYNGPPGSLLARLTSVDSSGDFCFDVPVKDPLSGANPVGGAYPWRLDNGYSTVVHLKNTIDRTVYAIVQVRFEGGTYNPERIKLTPFQTIALDMRQLRNSQQKDIRGGVMPRDVQSGQVVWYEEQIGSLIGRAEVFNIGMGVASSFSCDPQTCPPSHNDSYMSPSSATSTVGDQGQSFIPFETRRDSAGNIYGPYDMTSSSTWSSSNTSVATVGGNGWVSCVGAGTGSISASYQAVTYGQGCSIIYILITSVGSLTVKPTVSIGSGPRAVALGTAGNQITLSATGNPAGGSFLWFTFSDKVSLSNTNSSSVTVTSVSQSLSANDVGILVQYTLNGVTSSPTGVSITVQKPTSLSIVGTDSTTTETTCTTGGGLPGCGVIRTFQYQVNDQFGQAILVDGMQFWDSISNTTNNGCNLLTYETTCSPDNPNGGPCNKSTFSGGKLNERLSICAPACNSGGTCVTGCITVANATWNVNGISLTSDVKQLSYQCNRILVNGL